MDDGAERIADDEVLYRRIPDGLGWYSPGQDEKPSPAAFRASQRDVDGLSLSRAKYASADETCASGREGKQYFVAELRAGDLLAAGFTVDPDPLEDDPGHCLLREIRADNARTQRTQELKLVLAERLTRRVLGPYPGLRRIVE